jgi:hypothetical protein
VIDPRLIVFSIRSPLVRVLLSEVGEENDASVAFLSISPSDPSFKLDTRAGALERTR